MPKQLTEKELYVLQILNDNRIPLGLLAQAPPEELLVISAFLVAAVESQMGDEASKAFDLELRPLFTEIYPQLVAQAYKEAGETPGANDFVIVVPTVEGGLFEEPLKQPKNLVTLN